MSGQKSSETAAGGEGGREAGRGGRWVEGGEGGIGDWWVEGGREGRGVEGVVGGGREG